MVHRVVVELWLLAYLHGGIKRRGRNNEANSEDTYNEAFQEQEDSFESPKVSKTAGTTTIISDITKASLSAMRSVACPSTAVSSSSTHSRATTVSTCDSSTSSPAASFTTNKQKKRVGFSQKAQVCFTIAVQDISDEEYLAAWYTPEEYEDITASCRKQIHMLDKGATLKDKKYCARGLEAHTKVCSTAKTKNRSLSIRAVLEEQYRQSEHGIWNDELITHVYIAVSASCRVWANAVGLEDQREAETIMDCGLNSGERTTGRDGGLSTPLTYQANFFPRRSESNRGPAQTRRYGTDDCTTGAIATGRRRDSISKSRLKYFSQ
jgi:hypothetical protein